MQHLYIIYNNHIFSSLLNSLWESQKLKGRFNKDKYNSDIGLYRQYPRIHVAIYRAEALFWHISTALWLYY